MAYKWLKGIQTDSMPFSPFASCLRANPGLRSGVQSSPPTTSYSKYPYRTLLQSNWSHQESSHLTSEHRSPRRALMIEDVTLFERELAKSQDLWCGILSCHLVSDLAHRRHELNSLWSQVGFLASQNSQRGGRADMTHFLYTFTFVWCYFPSLQSWTQLAWILVIRL